MAELEKKLADYYKSQEPYIPEYVNVDDHKKSAQEFESTDSEEDFGKTDKFEEKFSESIPGKFTRGPYYPNEYLDTELMDDIFNEKKATFEEKECTLWAVMDGGKEKVAGGRIVADGALCLSMVSGKIVSPNQYKPTTCSPSLQMATTFDAQKQSVSPKLAKC
ncbi:hypothetical protein ACFE04_000425 [Oxalis oulophora]